MSVYATLQHLADAATGGWLELAQRATSDPDVDGALLQATAEAADRSAWSEGVQAAADAALARLQGALEMASRHADTYLFPRYRQQMPLPPALVAGSTRGMVILRITYHCLAPAIRADSSSVGSMRSSADTTCMNTKGK